MKSKKSLIESTKKTGIALSLKREDTVSLMMMVAIFAWTLGIQWSCFSNSEVTNLYISTFEPSLYCPSKILVNGVLSIFLFLSEVKS